MLGKNVNICMVCHSYYPSDPRVRREAECLRDEGYRVDIFCLKDSNQLASEMQDGIFVCRLPVRRHQGSTLLVYLAEYVAFFVLVSFIVAFYHVRRWYKVIQIHTLPDFLVFVALLPKLLGAKVLLDMHEVTPEFFMGKYGLKQDDVMIKFAAWIETVSSRFADHVLTVSQPLGDIIASRGTSKGKVSILMNVADDSLFDPKLYESIQPDPDVFRIMYHGAISELYDLDVVFRAVYILRSKIPRIRLYIFGDGPRMYQLRERITELDICDLVHVQGRIPQDEIPKEIRASDAGVVPIRNDGYTDLALPTKFLEYIAMGCPVVVSRRRTIESYFDDSCVMFFESSNEEELARCIEQLYFSPEKSTSLVSKATEMYQPYRWSIAKFGYCNLIAQLCNGW